LALASGFGILIWHWHYHLVLVLASGISWCWHPALALLLLLHVLVMWQQGHVVIFVVINVSGGWLAVVTWQWWLSLSVAAPVIIPLSAPPSPPKSSGL
jgi:hypothetical protein